MKGIVLDTTGELSLERYWRGTGEVPVPKHTHTVAVGETNAQSIEHLLRANRGEFKEMPLIGGEVVKHIGGQPDEGWCARVKKQIKSVGLQVRRVSMTETDITVE